MKKMIAFTMALVVILASASALSEDPDPIAGVWYCNFPIKGSVIESQYPDAVRFVIVVTFEADGKITYFEGDYNYDGTAVANTPTLIGQWTRSGDDYSVSWTGVGTNKAYLRGDELYIICLAPAIYYKFNRMITSEWYTDIIPELTISYYLQ